MKRFLEKRGNVISFLGLYSVYLVLTLFLFYRQSVSYGGRYISDMPSYIAEIQGIPTGYDFPYPVMFWIAKFLTYSPYPVWP